MSDNDFKYLILGELVKSLTDNDFKYWLQEFTGELLKIVKQKGLYPCEYMNSFKRFFADKRPDRCELYSSLSNNKFINEKNYLHAANV